MFDRNAFLEVEKFHLHQNKGLQPQDSPPLSHAGRRNAEDFEIKIQDYQDLIDAGSKDQKLCKYYLDLSK